MSEMDKLEKYLQEKDITYTRRRRFDEDFNSYLSGMGEVDGGEQIIAFENGRRIWDAVCGYGTYGAKDGLLEIMGKRLVNRNIDGDSVVGFLTAQDVIDRIESSRRRGKV